MKKTLLIVLMLIAAAIVGIMVLNKNQTVTPANTLTDSQTQTGNTTATTSQGTAPATCSGKQIIELTEGPYYTQNTPLKNDFSIDAAPGKKLTVSGYVFDTECIPVTGAWLDFWQADGKGKYDNNGYILRGHQYTDRDGKYKLTTVIPGEYPGRTPHIHVKVRAADASPTITSQLFIPGAAQNESDSIYDSSLLLKMKDANNATFDFVVNK